MGPAEGILLLLAVIAGYVLGRMGRHVEPAPPKPPEAVCGCTHHYSMHDPETGGCQVSTRGQVMRKNRDSMPVEWEWLNCPCLRYCGPEPLPQYVAPEIAEG